jgi:Na+/proline symporter
MSGFVNVALFFPRYMMVTGFTVLALVYFMPQLQGMGEHLDFELIMPYAIKNFIPVGLTGVLIAGLLAAFMSTFAATVNAAPPYIVNDIYKRYINPNADPKKYVRLSYVASLVLVVAGIAFGYIVESINDITLWIVGALWGGYAAANVLKWYWWRFNGYGFFTGMVTGIISAMVIPKMMAVFFPQLNDLYGFPFILVFSTIGCIAGSLLTPPDEDEVLKKFYMRVRPWGFWKPVYEKVRLDDPDFQRNRDFGRDCFNVVIGLIWQITLVALPMYIVIKEQSGIIYTGIVLVITSVILKKNWLDKLT